MVQDANGRHPSEEDVVVFAVDDVVAVAAGVVDLREGVEDERVPAVLS